MVFPAGSNGKVCLQGRRPGFYPSVRKIPWKREWQSTPVFLPGEFQGQRSLMGHSPRGTKSQTQLSNFHFKLQTYMKQILKLKRIVTCFELATPLAHPGLSTVPSRPPCSSPTQPGLVSLQRKLFHGCHGGDKPGPAAHT